MVRWSGAALPKAPRRAAPDIDKLRAALEQRAEQWKADVRSEAKVARLLLRRLVGPLTLWDAAEPASELKNGRCKFHGGLSTGPRTPEGVERSRRARWKPGAYSQETKGLAAGESPTLA